MKVALKTKAAILYETLSNDIYDSDNSLDSGPKMKCPNCELTFVSTSMLKAHVQTAHSEVEEALVLAELRETGKVSCPQCNRLFSSQHYLGQHIQFKHNAPAKPKPTVEGKRNRQVYLSQAEYNEMLAADGDEKWILCPHCLHVPFRAQQNLFQHLTIIHPDLALDPRVIQKLNDEKKNNNVHLLSSAATGEVCEPDRPLVKVGVGRKKKASAISGSGDGGAATVTSAVANGYEVEESGVKYDREARRKSYTNDFKASILEELQNGVSRKSLSLLHDIPVRTLDKWATTERDRILVASRFNHIAGHKRIRTDDLNSFIQNDENGHD